MRHPSTLLFAAVLAITLAPRVLAQDRDRTPARQSELTFATATPRPLTLREAARNDRWLGLGVRDVRWALDGKSVYFRWNRSPETDDVPDEDPWFLADVEGDWVKEVAPEHLDEIPGSDIRWSPDGKRASWVSGGSLYMHGQVRGTRRVVALDRPAREPRFTPDGRAVDFQMGSGLYRYDIENGTVTGLAVRVDRTASAETSAGAWLKEQQQELFAHVREQERIGDRVRAAERLAQAHLRRSLSRRRSKSMRSSSHPTGAG